MTDIPSGVPRPYPRRAVVTGAAGFIGSHIAQALLRRGATVIGVDHRDVSCDPLAAANLGTHGELDGYLHVTADLRTCAIEPLLLDADAVFHLAGLPGVHPSWGPQFAEYVHTNIVATQRLMEAAIRVRVPRVVVASSSSVYGATAGGASAETDLPQPISPYGVSKLAQEQLCLAHATRTDCPTSVVALRYFTVYGPRQRPDMFIHRVLTAALTGQPLRLFGQGHQRRDFTYIDDVTEATIAAGVAPANAIAVNIGGGTDVSLIDVINMVKALTGREIQLHADLARHGDAPTTRADTRRAESVLSWRPAVDLLTGMRAQLQALAQQPAYNGAA
ncbi:NAD(P)-dependent oxidoreductase [Streptomyces sp. TS71-3]|uniref:NAD-dependent epimerase/dehydratase family protein n=1 Tax=Streptomyces sp. TS71-3 TaxID=2733862 RepID=UPI001B0ADDB6|nr:NAD-dependent epimerase/dehydratase family protein [Streptomyces sp. TS71-3]GHJ35425.1 putative UDP-glucose epimerase YtcB [Streptomyces sp. TS71-3]